MWLAQNNPPVTEKSKRKKILHEQIQRLLIPLISRVLTPQEGDKISAYVYLTLMKRHLKF